jgi:hypothetical protein
VLVWGNIEVTIPHDAYIATPPYPTKPNFSSHPITTFSIPTNSSIPMTFTHAYTPCNKYPSACYQFKLIRYHSTISITPEFRKRRKGFVQQPHQQDKNLVASDKAHTETHDTLRLHSIPRERPRRYTIQTTLKARQNRRATLYFKYQPKKGRDDTPPNTPGARLDHPATYYIK